MVHVAVAGGTGVVGRFVVAAFTGAGHEVTVLARSVGVDLLDRDGVARALRPTSVVIDVANVAATSKRRAVGFFDRATTNLLDAERRAGVTHHLALSIVGVDRVDFGYYLGKRRQEELVRTGPVPWTILRATQFHEFPRQLASRVPGPVVPVPTMTTQPVAAREVAQTLLALASAGPSGSTIEMAGPEIHRMPDLTRRLLRAHRARRLVLPVRMPGTVGRAMASDGLLPRAGARRGRQTFDEWLAEDRSTIESAPGSST